MIYYVALVVAGLVALGEGVDLLGLILMGVGIAGAVHEALKG